MSTAPYRLHDSLGYHLSLAARLQERRLEEGLRSLGLTRTTWCILLGVANEGLSQPSELAQFVGIDRTATSRALRQMEDAGLLDRAAGDGDRRTRQITLTEKGRSAVAEGTPFAEANSAAMAAALGPARTEELIRLLKSLTEGAETNLARL